MVKVTLSSRSRPSSSVRLLYCTSWSREPGLSRVREIIWQLGSEQARGPVLPGEAVGGLSL